LDAGIHQLLADAGGRNGPRGPRARETIKGAERQSKHLPASMQLGGTHRFRDPTEKTP
jgi:hypothetical protein